MSPEREERVPPPPLEDETNSTIASSAEEIPYGPEALAQLKTQFAELGRQIAFYATLRLDGVKLSAQSLFLRGFFLLGGVIMISSALVVGTILFLLGLSGALSRLIGGAAWTGHLSIGIICLSLVVSATVLSAKRVRVNLLKRRIHDYQHRPT